MVTTRSLWAEGGQDSPATGCRLSNPTRPAQPLLFRQLYIQTVGTAEAATVHRTWSQRSEVEKWPEHRGLGGQSCHKIFPRGLTVPYSWGSHSFTSNGCPFSHTVGMSTCLSTPAPPFLLPRRSLLSLFLLPFGQGYGQPCMEVPGGARSRGSRHCF